MRHCVTTQSKYLHPIVRRISHRESRPVRTERNTKGIVKLPITSTIRSVGHLMRHCVTTQSKYLHPMVIRISHRESRPVRSERNTNGIAKLPITSTARAVIDDT